MTKNLVTALRSLLLFAGMITIILCFAALLFFVVGTPSAPVRRRQLARSCGRVCLRWFAISAGLDHRIEGGEHLEGVGHGPTIFFWRHESAWETFLSLVIVPEPTWVLKRELLWIPIVGWGIYLLDPIAINRGSGRLAVSRVLERGRRQLESGRILHFFPEGTRLAPGERRRYGLSGALLASALGATIVPVAHDAGTYWPRRGFLKKKGVIRVVIGPPSRVPPGMDPAEINAHVATWMEGTLERLGPSRVST